MNRIFQVYSILFFVLIANDFICLIWIKGNNQISRYLNLGFYDVSLCLIYVLLVYIAQLIIFESTKTKKTIYKITTPCLPETALFVNIFSVLFCLFFCTDIFKGYFTGFNAYMLGKRSGEISLGILGYYSLIGSSVLLSVYWDSIHPRLNKVLLSLFTVDIFLTGYRQIIVWALIIFIVKYLLTNSKIEYKKWILRLAGILLIFYFYGVVREQAEHGGNYIHSTPVFEIFNRSRPLSYLFIALEHGQELDFLKIIDISFRPIIIIYSRLFHPSVELYNYEVSVVAEQLFGQFLIWRGTGNYLATGFSIHYIAFFIVHGKTIGTIISIIIPVLLLHLGSILTSDKSPLLNNLGLIVYSLVLAINESYSVAMGLFVWTILFIIGIELLNKTFRKNNK